MANHFTGLPALEGTFSRLVPASRSLAFQFPSQLPNRVSPDLHPSTDKTSRSTEQHPDTDLGQEMRDVETKYTLCLRRQDLSQSERAFYGVIVDMARGATAGVTSAESAASVRSMDNYVRNTVADFRVANQNLAVMEEDARLYRFHAHLGDFSAYLCDILRMGEPSTSLLKAPWTTIIKALDKEDNDMDAWEASVNGTNRPRTPYGDAIRRRVQALIRLGQDDVDTDIALFAVRTYARRNLIAHGASYALDKSGDCAGLALYLEDVDKNLVTALPDVEKPLVDKYRRLLNIYRNRKIQLKNGNWVSADQLPSQPKTTSAASSGSPDVKSPGDILLDKIHQLQDELCQANYKTLKGIELQLRDELEGLKKTFQRQLKRSGGSKNS